MTDEKCISELLERILESKCDSVTACAEFPQLLPTLRQRLDRIRRVDRQIDQLFPPNPPAVDNAVWTGPSTTKLPLIQGYELDGILGYGGMGVVYKAKHLKLNRIVALKMLLSGPLASPQEIARFERETRVVAALPHPHIVQIHDVGNIDGQPFYTMEFADGGNLAQQLAGAPQPARRAAELVAILAAAVQQAHAKGIIHRDLKPANILLTDDGTPKIADFGLARYVDGDLELTIVGIRMGTLSYMAPEQLIGPLGSIGPSVDIYALGSILYEMLTGRAPFKAESAVETQRQVTTVEATPPSRLNAKVPRDLETICLKCLRKDPARRYSGAAELADDLHRFLARQPIRARPVRMIERVWCWGIRNRGVAAALSGIAVLLSALIVGAILAAVHFQQLERKHRELVLEMESVRARSIKTDRDFNESKNRTSTVSVDSELPTTRSANRQNPLAHVGPDR